MNRGVRAARTKDIKGDFGIAVSPCPCGESAVAIERTDHATQGFDVSGQKITHYAPGDIIATCSKGHRYVPTAVEQE